MARSDALIEPEWLQQNLSAPNVKVVDGSWYLSTAQRDPRAEYAGAHIAGARFFDIESVCDPVTSLPHMLPSPEAFSAAVGGLGIGNGDQVVVYDGAGLLSAPRVWWMFRVFGHDNVFVLDGGLARWRAENRPVDATPSSPEPTSFEARFRPELVRTLQQMRESSAQIVDARSRGRFLGTDPEPRPGLRSGHIPGSFNLPYTDIVEDGALVDAQRLRERFKAAGIDLAGDIHTTCGSGMTAAILTLALFTIGHREAALYDGSWTEWGGRPDTPVESPPPTD